MSIKERDPLLSDEHRDGHAPYKWQTACYDAWLWGFDHCRHEYEAARAKDAELIQQLVDALYRSGFVNRNAEHEYKVLAIAKAAGFTPSEG